MGSTKKKRGEKHSLIDAVDDILRGQDEAEVLKRHHVSKEAFDDSLNNPEFIRQVRNRIGGSIVRTRLLIAQYAQVAAAKLISLTECEKEETARKACLDVIVLAQKQSEETVLRDKVGEIIESASPVLSEEQASKMLALLTEPEGGNGQGE